MHNCPLLAPQQTSARIDFLRQGERLVDKKATFCVKFLAENYTKRLRRIHVHGQRHVAPTGLQPPTRTDAGHAAHGQWGQHHGNAEVILTLALCCLA